MLTDKIVKKILKEQTHLPEVNTKDSAFLQNLVSGKKMFVQIFSPKYIIDYASELEIFLNTRGIKVLKVNCSMLNIETSHGKIWFCVGSPNYRNSNLYRDNFLRGRHDFVEIYCWEDVTLPTR